mgnify:CR=1 FL=1
MRYSIVIVGLLLGLISSCTSTPVEEVELKNASGKDQAAVGENSNGVLDSLNELLELHPEDASLYMERAKWFLEQRNYGRADLDLQKALDLEPSNTKYLLAYGNHMLFTNQSRKAKDVWLICAEVDSSNVSCRLKLAELYLLVQQYDDVFKYSKEVSNLAPEKHMPYFYTGMAFMEKGDTARAIHSFQTSLEKKTDFLRGMEQLAHLYGLKGEYIAVDYYNNMLNLDPNRSLTYFNLATFYQSKGEYEKASSIYLLGLQLAPENAGMYYNLGFVYTSMKEFDKAQLAFTNAIKFDDVYFEAYFARGYVYTQLENNKKALEDYKSCLLLKPGYLPALNEIERIEGK